MRVIAEARIRVLVGFFCHYIFEIAQGMVTMYMSAAGNLSL